MDRAKLTLVLNQRLADGWSLEGLSLDETVLAGVADEWEALTPNVKCNVLCALLALSSRAKSSLYNVLARVTSAARADKDEWVRIVGAVVEPLVAESPRPVSLDDQPGFLATVTQLRGLIAQHGRPAWAPAFEALVPDDSDSRRESNPNSFFVVPKEKKRVPLQPHPNPEELVPTEKPILAPSVDLSRVAKKPMASTSDRKSGGTLRGTSTLMEKKPYQQKKVVKALTTQQVGELLKKELAADTKRQAQPIAAPVAAVPVAAATATTAPINDPYSIDSLAEAPEPQNKMAKVYDDLISLTSVLPGPSVPVLVPSASKDAEAADGLTSLLSFGDDLASFAKPQDAPKNE